MTTVALSVFHSLQFPHLGKIVSIDHLDFCLPDVTAATANNIPMLGKSPPPYQSVGVILLKDSSLMGVFPLTTPSMEVATVNMISMDQHIPKGK